MKTILRTRVHITPDMEKTNIPLPFSVPAGVQKLRIVYSYAPKELSGAVGETIAEACLLRDADEFRGEYLEAASFLPLKNLVTLSLDDPHGYRGAAHRQAPQQVHILSETEASPGFYKGAVSAGAWKLTLNVHALVTEFCDCDIRIEAEERADAFDTRKWFACELHCHTVHSDGDFTVETLLATALERKLDGIALTDHNTQSGVPNAQNIGAPVVLGGMEWTTYFGHMPVLDCKRDVDWRDALPDTIDEKLRQVHENGGICGAAHPFQIGTPICTGGHWDYRVQDWSLVNYIEIWSEGSPYLNTANRRAIGLWESILDKGFRLTPTFGRDWHRPTNNIYPAACTYLLCDSGNLTPEKMKTAIRDGRTVVSAGPLFYFKTETGASVGDTVQAGEAVFCIHMDTARADSVSQANRYAPRTVRIITNGGEKLLEQPFGGGEMQMKVMLRTAHWYRAELWGEIDGKTDCQIAVTAPIYTV